MGDKTAIEWTDATWNPLAGCGVVSRECTNCYAMREAHRLGERLGLAKYQGLTKVVNGKPVWIDKIRLHPEHLDQPLRWRRPRLIFVNSMSDIGHPDLPQQDFEAIVYTMIAANQHLFQVLTKRPYVVLDRLNVMLATATRDLVEAMPHIWWGASVGDQRGSDQRHESMRSIHYMGLKTWVSYEPALGPVDWSQWSFIDGMVCGGESGPDARPMHPAWARAARDWCAQHGIPFDFKQWGSLLPHGQWPVASMGRLWRTDWLLMDRDGNLDLPYGRWPNEEAGEVAALRVNKKTAGRELDGLEHGGFTHVCRSQLIALSGQKRW